MTKDCESPVTSLGARAVWRSFHDVLGSDFYRYKVPFSLRRDVPVGVPLDLSTPTGMSCIGTYGENCKSDNVSKYRVLLVAFLLLWHEN